MSEPVRNWLQSCRRLRVMEPGSAVRSIMKADGISIYGFADPSRWDSDPVVSANVPPERRPLALMPGARSVIVFGIPVSRTVLATAPSVFYRSHYDILNQRLDSVAQHVSSELESMGYRCAPVPRDGYLGVAPYAELRSFFSHKHAAYLAGLGTFGANSTILTPSHGPRVRFVSVITEAPIPDSGGPMDTELCTECGLCASECPASAIGDSRYPGSRIDKQACASRSAELVAHKTYPCGRCILVCPVGGDDPLPPTEEAKAQIRALRKP